MSQVDGKTPNPTRNAKSNPNLDPNANANPNPNPHKVGRENRSINLKEFIKSFKSQRRNVGQYIPE